MLCHAQVKSSVQRSIRTKLLEQMPLLAEPSAARPEPVTTTDANGEASTSQAEAPTVLDAIWPRKEDIALVKWCVGRSWSHLTPEAGIACPSSRSMASRYSSTASTGPGSRRCTSCIAVRRVASGLVLTTTDPDLLPRVQTDRGAVRFILGGAALMACVCCGSVRAN